MDNNLALYKMYIGIIIGASEILVDHLKKIAEKKLGDFNDPEKAVTETVQSCPSTLKEYLESVD